MGILSIVSLLVSVLGIVFYALSFKTGIAIPVFVILAIASVVLPPIAKKVGIETNKNGTWMEIAAIVVGGFNFYFLIFAFVPIPIFVGYLGWVVCGIVYKLVK